jgi:hypothetical protein
VALDPTQPLTLARHADLKSRTDGLVLVLPERALRIGGSGAEILGLISEGGSANDVIAALHARYPEAPSMETEVLAFLEEMLALGGLAPRAAREGVGTISARNSGSS